MTEKEFIKCLRAMLSLSDECPFEVIIQVLVEMQIKAYGGKMDYSALREAQEAF